MWEMQRKKTGEIEKIITSLILPVIHCFPFHPSEQHRPLSQGIIKGRAATITQQTQRSSLFYSLHYEVIVAIVYLWLTHAHVAQSVQY